MDRALDQETGRGRAVSSRRFHGFVGLARSVLLAAVDPEEGRRAIAPLKCNLAAKPKTVEYRIDDEGRFWWGRTSDLTAEKLSAPPTNRGGAVNKAQEFKGRSRQWPETVNRSRTLAGRPMLSDSSIERARKNLNIQAFRPLGKDSVWMMALPGGRTSAPSPGELLTFFTPLCRFLTQRPSRTAKTFNFLAGGN